MNHKKILFLCSFGALFEYYDFAIFALLMPIFTTQFFSGGNPTVDAIKTFAIFTSGYMARLAGGIWYSHQSDKYGRKKPFLQTLLLMALPTAFIGFLPNYAQIGIAAPFLLLLCRIFQGLAMGGESPSALTIVYESSPEKYKTTSMGVILGSIVLGSFIGALVISILTFFQGENTFQEYGWRIPFIFGGFLCIIGALLRKNLQETSEFINVKNTHKTVAMPFYLLFKNYRLPILKGILLGTPTATSFIYYLLMPYTFLEPFYHVTITNLIYLSSLGIVINSFFVVLFGYLADKWDIKKMYIIGIICIGVWAFISHFIFLTQNIFYIYLSIYVMAFCIGIPTGCLYHMNLKRFPTEVRTSGISTILNITNGLIVGNIPLFFTFMVKSTHLSIFPAIFIGMISFIAIIVIIFSQELDFKR